MSKQLCKFELVKEITLIKHDLKKAALEQKGHFWIEISNHEVAKALEVGFFVGLKQQGFTVTSDHCRYFRSYLISWS